MVYEIEDVISEIEQRYGDDTETVLSILEKKQEVSYSDILEWYLRRYYLKTRAEYLEENRPYTEEYSEEERWEHCLDEIFGDLDPIYTNIKNTRNKIEKVNSQQKTTELSILVFSLVGGISGAGATSITSFEVPVSQALFSVSIIAIFLVIALSLYGVQQATKKSQIAKNALF